MQFDKLKLSGFKSFVEPAELRIEPGLTGVVGPNGCGKSNLLEALRWVMGESSAKSLRGGGMDDVIFAGTAARPSRDFAEVALFATGRLASNDDADAQLEIVRRIERGAGSAYRINGREVRAKDITLVFADAATGAHSPALVSQGRIAAVIAAKPTERRMMLEEAAGIAGLHVRRRDAESRLRATEVNIARLDDLLAGLASQIAALRRQARAAERYRSLSDRIKLAEARTVFARWREAAAAADHAREEGAAAERAVAVAAAEAAECQQAQHAAAAASVKARDALTARREASAAHGHLLVSLKAQLEAAEQRLGDLDRQLARLDADQSEAGRLTRDAVASLARLREDLAAREAAIAEHDASRPALAAAAEEAERATRAAEVALARAQAEQAGTEAEWRIAEAAVASARAALARHTAERQRREGEAAALAGNAEPEAAVMAAMTARDTARAVLGEAQQRRDALSARRGTLVVERDAAGDALAKAKAELAGITRELEALQRERQARERSSGGPTAIDRLRAAPGYERALGAALRDDGRAALGTPAEGVTGRHWAGAPAPDPLPDSLARHVPVAPPELAARLALVRFAENDDGQSLAPGEWLVTRDGALRRWDGFLVRGEGASEAAALESANRLATLEAEAPRLEQARERAAARAESTAAALATTQRDLAAAEQALAAAAGAERTALRALDQAEAARDRHAARKAEIDRALADLAARDETLGAELAAATDRRDALPDPAAGREALERARLGHDGARQRLQQATAALAALDQALAAGRERRALLRGEIRSWEARSGDAEKRIAAVVARREELAGERTVLAARPEGLRRDIAAADDAGRELAAQLAAAEQDSSASEAAAAEAERRLAAASEALSLARETRAAALARAESQEARRAEMSRLAGERFACPAPVIPARFEFDAGDVGEASAEQTESDRLIAERERLGPVNLVAADELAEAEAKHGQSAAEQAELTEAVNRLRGSIGSLNREGRERLRAAFAAVDTQFRRLFGQLFDGGAAHLAMIDSDDPLEAGLEIYAQPPGKRLQSLTLLSGGEQALTAVALIFALFLTKPAPICVLDEVDAPLDDANVERFCDLLDFMVAETRTRYLIVTHNAVTMSRMHRLFGVTMVEQGVSRLVSVDLGAAEELLAAE